MGGVRTESASARGVYETIAKMDSSLRAELDALRLRAYGPKEDRALDSETVRRLQELEARARGVSSVHDGPGGTSEPPVGPKDAPALQEAQQLPAVESVPPQKTDARGRVRRFRQGPNRLMLALWAMSVAASAGIAAAATFSTVAILPVAVVDDAPQIATLNPDPTVTVPAGFNGAGASSVTYEFFGLTLFETSYGMFGGGGDDCFAAVLTADIPEDGNIQGGYSMSGPSYSGCRVGDFPATIAMPVDNTAPPELREQFPDGALQFVKDGDRIGVFLGENPRS